MPTAAEIDRDSLDTVLNTIGFFMKVTYKPYTDEVGVFHPQRTGRIRAIDATTLEARPLVESMGFIGTASERNEDRQQLLVSGKASIHEGDSVLFAGFIKTVSKVRPFQLEDPPVTLFFLVEVLRERVA